jgi:hypothetical protein
MTMPIDQTNVIDYASINDASGDLWLTISDHLPWDENEGGHLALLQDKLTAYLHFIESGEVFDKVRDARGRNIVITVLGKFPLSPAAEAFLENARSAIETAGLRLQFMPYQP